MLDERLKKKNFQDNISYFLLLKLQNKNKFKLNKINVT